MKRKLIVFLLILISYCQVFYAQVDRAVVRGRVIDAKQLPVSGAQVRLFQKSTNESRLNTSGNEGEFVFAFLTPGSYRLEVEQPGHRKVAQDLELFVNQELRANVALEV
ncbi:MAG: carboxypeptidase-like regulatory domain-containing protein, partial [Terriglobia bacterium]